MLSQTYRFFFFLWDHSAPSDLYVASEARLFSQDLYQRAGLWWDKWAGCSACRMKRKKGLEKEGGPCKSPFLALLLFHFIGSPYAQNTRAWKAEPGRQSGYDITHGKRSQASFFLFSFCLLLTLLPIEAGASRSITAWCDRKKPEELEQHHSNWTCPPYGRKNQGA